MTSRSSSEIESNDPKRSLSEKFSRIVSFAKSNHTEKKNEWFDSIDDQLSKWNHLDHHHLDNDLDQQQRQQYRNRNQKLSNNAHWNNLDSFRMAGDNRTIVRNELFVGTITIAKHHGQMFLCKISNSNLTKSMDLIVRIEVVGENSKTLGKTELFFFFFFDRERNLFFLFPIF